MDRVILIFAAVGIVLLWHRAEPLRPIRIFLLRWLNRWWEGMVVGRRTFWRIPAWPLWWLKGVVGCGECLAPYCGAGVAFVAGERWWSIPMGLSVYAIYVLTERRSSDQTMGDSQRAEG